MNSTDKLVAAAQRAARKLSRTESISYQKSLDHIAIAAGRSTWASFLADPVPVDDASGAAAAEPDFTSISHDGHLHAAIEYGATINARALLARPPVADMPAKLVYCRERGAEFDLPIDARGISVTAMIATIASSSTAKNGLVMLQDVESAYELDDLGGDMGMQLRLSLDLNEPPVAPIIETVQVEGEEAERRRKLSATIAAMRNTPNFPDFDNRYELLVHLVGLPALREGVDVRIDPVGGRYDVVLHAGRAERVLHTINEETYNTIRAMIKDRGRMDQMEMRVSQYGDWMQEIEGDLLKIHVASEPTAGGFGMETIRIGLLPFTRRNVTYVKQQEVRSGGCIPLGEYGLLRRIPQYAEEDDLIVVSGRPGSGRTGRFVVPAIKEVHWVDVVVSDMKGDLLSRLGSEWEDRGPVLRIDTRMTRTKRTPAFNPFHPDMMPIGHLEAAASVAGVLLHGADASSITARDTMIGIVDLMIVAEHLRPDGYDDEQAVSIPMIVDWFDQNFDRIDGMMPSIDDTSAIRAAIHLQRIVDLSSEARAKVRQRMEDAFAFTRSESMRAILDPAVEDRGGDVARALSLSRNPALIIVGGRSDKDEGRLAALLMEIVVKLREAISLRRTHIHVDDATKVGWMPWLDAAIADRDKVPLYMAVSVVIENATDIDKLSIATNKGIASGIRHWLIEEIGEPDQRQRVADAMGVRISKVSSHRADGRRLDIMKGSARLLRR